MSTEVSPEKQVEAPVTEKEKNFRQQEAYFKGLLEKERQEKEKEKQEKEKLIEELNQAKLLAESAREEDLEDPVKKVEKVLNKWEGSFASKMEKTIEAKAKSLLEAKEKEIYLKNTKDLSEVLNEKNLARLFEDYPDVAENLMAMPDNFERQKLVYNTMKSLNIHKPKKDTSVQDTIAANRQNPYFSNSGIGHGGYAGGGDFSEAGQKAAYDSIQALKKQLRL